MGAIDLLNECRRLHRAAWQKTSDPATHHQIVVWAAVVHANRALWAPGDIELPAAVVVSTDEEFDADPEILTRIAKQVHALYQTTPTDPVLNAFAAEVSDETPRAMNLTVPAVFTGPHTVYFETLRVPRDRLPARFLSQTVLPVTMVPGRPTTIQVLPLALWAPALVRIWNSQPKPPVKPPPLPGVSSQYQKNPLRLTPAAVATIRSIIARQKLSPVWLRVSAERGAYGLDLTEKAPSATDDLLITEGDLNVIVNRRCAADLTGMVIDFVEDGPNRGFKFSPGVATQSPAQVTAAAPSPHDDAPDNPALYKRVMDDCRKRIGDPPRTLPDLDWMYLQMATPKWLINIPGDRCHEIYKNQQVLMDDGRVVWAALVQANARLFKKEEGDSPAMVVYSTDPKFDGGVARLRKIAAAMFAVKGTSPDDPDVADFAAHITNERERRFHSPVPIALSGQNNVFQSTVMVVRKHLPRGYLNQLYFPLLICPEKCATCMILPSCFWPNSEPAIDFKSNFPLPPKGS